MEKQLRRVILQSMQVAHLVLVFLVPPLWFAVRETSEPEDSLARTIAAIVGLSTVAWGSLVVVLAIRHGDKDVGVRKLFSKYRQLLNSVFFLVVSNGILAVSVSLLAYQACAYRQVEFTAHNEGRLVLSDTPGAPEFLGMLRPNVPKRFRLKNGRRLLAFHTDGAVLALSAITVSPWWHDVQILQIDIPPQGSAYETTK